MLRIILSLILAALILSVIYLFYPVFVVTGNPLLIVNMWDSEELPKKFRMSTDLFTKTEGSSAPSSIGLKELLASGSAQFSEKSLGAILKKIPSQHITIVDLRQESHGFVNGTAVSWFVERDWANKGKTLPEVLDDENRRLKEITEWPIATLYASRKFPVPVWVKSSFSEAELAATKNLGYLRIPVTDHMRPTDADVDVFINFVKSLPKDTVWLHFHCAAGEGRTTTFLAMYDMMRNATKVKLHDIFLRQHLIGGINFLSESASDWRKSYFEDRKQFLRQFYVYCQQNPLFQKTWSTWSSEQKLDKQKQPNSNHQTLNFESAMPPSVPVSCSDKEAFFNEKVI